MQKFFNTAGPCDPDKHYILSSQKRCKGIFNLIEQEQYVVIHAARQSGKTTLLFDLVQDLNYSGDYYAIYCSLESVQEITESKEGIPAIFRSLKTEIELNEVIKGFCFSKKPDYSEF